jgi:hypothetical protein
MTFKLCFLNLEVLLGRFFLTTCHKQESLPDEREGVNLHPETSLPQSHCRLMTYTTVKSQLG